MNPTKQTADSEARCQSLPIWGDLEGYYHPDHLGSSSWITDQDGEAIQHLQYLPFGEQYIDQRTTGWDAMFTFSGKERDQETGYSYFGARYYDSDLSIWLSVDPMADKYPHQSNYVYCSNNPIRLVDPDGMDEYEFDKKGKLLNVIENENADILRIVKTDRKGNIKSDKQGKTRVVATSKEFAVGTVTGHSEIGDKTTTLDISNDESRGEMFKFLATTTSVEWETFTGCTANGGQDFNKIGTNQSSEWVNVFGNFIDMILDGQGLVDEHTHSHKGAAIEGPSGYSTAPWVTTAYGEGDHAAANKYHGKIPIMKVFDVDTRSTYQYWGGAKPGFKKL